MNNATLRLQTELKRLGFDPGPLNGIPGRLTAGAVRRYQASRFLHVDGVVGPETLTALRLDGAILGDSAKRPASLTPWIDEADRMLGTTEIAGERSNATIIGWARALGAKILGAAYQNDDVAWCGLFVAHCLAVTLPEEPIPPIALRALSWRDFGVGLGVPLLGCVGVFERPGGGHVGFLIGERETTLDVLGGNQGNSVRISRIEKNRLVAARWPKTVPLSAHKLPQIAAIAPRSTNEA